MENPPFACSIDTRCFNQTWMEDRLDVLPDEEHGERASNSRYDERNEAIEQS